MLFFVVVNIINAITTCAFTLQHTPLPIHYLHVVDHCLKQDELVITLNTHHTPYWHCSTLCHLVDTPWGLAAPGCVGKVHIVLQVRTNIQTHALTGGPYSTQNTSLHRGHPRQQRGKADSIPASWKGKTLHTAHLHRWVDCSLQQRLLYSQLEQNWSPPQPLHFFHFLSKHRCLLS